MVSAPCPAASSRVLDKHMEDISFLTANSTAKQVIYSIHVSLRFKYIYVETPKAGCSSVKLFLMRNENPDGLFPISNEISETEFERIHSRELSPLLNIKQVYPFRALLQSGKFFRFCFVRNPYARLLSAYLDRIVKNKPQAAPIRKLMGIAGDREANISFADFVECVCGQTVAEMNPHWRVQYFQTYQNVIQYDYIGRVEDMRTAISHISRVVGLDDRLFTPFYPHRKIAGRN